MCRVQVRDRGAWTRPLSSLAAGDVASVTCRQNATTALVHRHRFIMKMVMPSLQLEWNDDRKSKPGCCGSSIPVKGHCE